MAMKFPTPTYNKRITIQSKTVTQNSDYGTEAITWATFASVWAEIQDVLPSKSESVAQGIAVATRPARIRIRYLSGITSDMRIIVTGPPERTMQIIGGPSELGRKNGIELMAAEYSS